MKNEKELAQFGQLEVLLSGLMRVTLGDETATVSYDKAADTLSLKSSVMEKSVSVWGDNARAAVYDFVCQTLGKLIL